MKKHIQSLFMCFLLAQGLWQVCREPSGEWCAYSITFDGSYAQVACFEKRKDAVEFVEAQ